MTNRQDRSFHDRIKAKFVFSEALIQPLQRKYDRYLMDIAIESGIFTTKELISLNACRLYYDVITASDICKADGEHIAADIDWRHRKLFACWY